MTVSTRAFIRFYTKTRPAQLSKRVRRVEFYLVDGDGGEMLAAHGVDKGDAHYVYTVVDELANVYGSFACKQRAKIEAWLWSVVAQSQQRSSGDCIESDESQGQAQETAPAKKFVDFRHRVAKLDDGRRVHKYFLIGAENDKESLAVIGTETSLRDGHYHYCAQEPFSTMQPLSCGRRSDVLTYLYRWLDPARMANKLSLLAILDRSGKRKAQETSADDTTAHRSSPSKSKRVCNDQQMRRSRAGVHRRGTETEEKSTHSSSDSQCDLVFDNAVKDEVKEAAKPHVVDGTCQPNKLSALCVPSTPEPAPPTKKQLSDDCTLPASAQQAPTADAPAPHIHPARRPQIKHADCSQTHDNEAAAMPRDATLQSAKVASDGEQTTDVHAQTAPANDKQVCEHAVPRELHSMHAAQPQRMSCSMAPPAASHASPHNSAMLDLALFSPVPVLKQRGGSAARGGVSATHMWVWWPVSLQRPGMVGCGAFWAADVLQWVTDPFGARLAARVQYAADNAVQEVPVEYLRPEPPVAFGHDSDIAVGDFVELLGPMTATLPSCTPLCTQVGCVQQRNDDGSFVVFRPCHRDAASACIDAPRHLLRKLRVYRWSGGVWHVVNGEQSWRAMVDDDDGGVASPMRLRSTEDDEVSAALAITHLHSTARAAAA